MQPTRFPGWKLVWNTSDFVYSFYTFMIENVGSVLEFFCPARKLMFDIPTWFCRPYRSRKPNWTKIRKNKDLYIQKLKQFEKTFTKSWIPKLAQIKRYTSSRYSFAAWVKNDWMWRWICPSTTSNRSERTREQKKMSIWCSIKTVRSISSRIFDLNLTEWGNIVLLTKSKGGKAGLLTYKVIISRLLTIFILTWVS